jgi:acetyl-CoA/propionyl-CoA carboxylase biotin carboxyl carrier protein
MMAKLIVKGPTRDATLIRARRALTEFRIEGVASVLPFHRAVLDEPAFTAETGFKVHTNWIETEFPELAPEPRVDPSDPALLRSFIEIDGKRHAIALPAALFAGLAAPQSVAEDTTAVAEDTVTAPIPGALQQWLVKDGAEVAAGEAVAVIEAMKMETRISAPRSGRIRIMQEVGVTIGLGASLAVIE